MSGGGKRFFVDTNVLLYSLDPADPAKQRRASHWMKLLWHNQAGRISWQVVNEFYSNATRKLHREPAGLRAEARSLALWEPVGFGLGVIERAWHWMDKAGLPYWDSLILASTEAADCTYLLSEDFQAGQRFGDITVVDPFQRRPEEFGLA
ncbi:MAG: PIN domain-containing protein [Bryobacteraceae bacterium]|jgi:predicted nucleic acid-binding protein